MQKKQIGTSLANKMWVAQCAANESSFSRSRSVLLHGLWHRLMIFRTEKSSLEEKIPIHSSLLLREENCKKLFFNASLMIIEWNEEIQIFHFIRQTTPTHNTMMGEMERERNERKEELKSKQSRVKYGNDVLSRNAFMAMKFCFFFLCSTNLIRVCMSSTTGTRHSRMSKIGKLT